MRRRKIAFGLLASLLMSSAQAVTLVIDDFTELQGPLQRTAPGDIGIPISDSMAGVAAVGGERDIEVSMTAGNAFAIIRVFTNGEYNHGQEPSVTGASEIVWDGPDGDGSVLDPTGLGGIDLTAGATQDAFNLVLSSADLNSTLELEVYTDAGNASTHTIALPGAVASPESLVIPYSAFTPLAGAGADFTNVGAILFRIDGNAVPALDVVVDLLETTQVLTADKTVTDLNGGNLEPGDTLAYSITVSNPDDLADLTAQSITVSDVLPAFLSLDCTAPNDPSTSQGTITACTPGPGGSFDVNIGDIIDTASITIDFQASVVNPFPAGVTQVCNQATVQGFLSQLTNDPGTPAASDPTCLPVVAAPVISSTKVDSILIDQNADSVANPGDTLQYDIQVTNSGNQDANNVLFTDTVDANTLLICAPMPVVSQGSVTACNAGPGGDFSVDLGTIAGAGGNATISVQASIANPIPAGLTQVCNQGDAAGVPTDDPDVGGPADPTCTSVVGAVIIEAMKTVLDTSGDNMAQANEILSYTITVSNTGNQDSGNITFTDTVDVNAVLVCPPTASQGTVVSCNAVAGGDMNIDLGVIPAAASATIQFDVQTIDPLPDNIMLCNQGDAGGVPTDDPNAPGIDDPTCLPTNAPAPPPPAVDVPTLSPMGILFMMMLLLGVSFPLLRQKQ